MFDSKIRMKCAACDVIFEGYHLQICDKCLDKQLPNERIADLIERLREQNKSLDYSSKVKLYFKLPPELTDGQHWTVVETPEEVLEAVGNWCNACIEWGGAGESIRIERIEMDEDEVAALPDI